MRFRSKQAVESDSMSRRRHGPNRRRPSQTSKGVVEAVMYRYAGARTNRIPRSAGRASTENPE